MTLFYLIYLVLVSLPHTDWSISLDVPPSIHHGLKRILLQSQEESINAVVLSQRAGAKYSRDIDKRRNNHQKKSAYIIQCTQTEALSLQSPVENMVVFARHVLAGYH